MPRRTTPLSRSLSSFLTCFPPSLLACTTPAGPTCLPRQPFNLRHFLLLKSGHTNTLLCRCTAVSNALDYEQKRNAPIPNIYLHKAFSKREVYKMNEATAWRHALAQQLAPHYSANPKVAAIAVLGSVTLGCADRYSDIDLGVFWAAPPTEQEGRDVIERVEGKRWRRFPSNSGADQWSEVYQADEVTVDVRHSTVETMERILADVLEHYDPSLLKQQHIATLLSAFPLYNPMLLPGANKSSASSASTRWPGCTSSMNSLRRPSAWCRRIWVSSIPHKSERSLQIDPRHGNTRRMGSCREPGAQW